MTDPASLVISGIGVVSPVGIGVAAHWKGTLDRRSGIQPIDAALSGGSGIRVAGVVPDFDPADFLPRRLQVQTDRWCWMGLAAAELALADAAVGTFDPYRLAVLTAGSAGGNEYGQREIQALWREGPRAVSAYQSIAWFYAALAGQVSIRHGAKGRCGVAVADAAGGLHAAAQARRLLLRGQADQVLVGAAEAPLSPYALVCQSSLGRHSGADTARGAYLPFSERAAGSVPGEGGAMLVLERADTARARGAQVYAELASVACTHDAHHPADPPPTAAHMAEAVALALERAGVTPAEVDVILADGDGNRCWDELEAEALVSVLGARALEVPLAVPKTLTGRLNSACGVLDLAWAALALFHDVVPPAREDLDGQKVIAGLDVVRAPRRDTNLRTALVFTRGVGGFNAAAVLRTAGGPS
ncbi:beta-ketoacyl synthase N-terminal-like domain-containing protein [Nonomuraea bangladeshensis]|uniref:beta-ketoacyl synthase N-terminal-like domain-containing protein n=1 Tax=Nonomuraea bangladeshensis TaxID=404385 RepID=UPI0031D37CE8